MLEAILAATLAEGHLDLTVTLRNTGRHQIIVAARAPFNLKDTGRLYVSAAKKKGYVNLLLGDPVVPPYMNVYQPDSAFYRKLEPNEKIQETFKLPLPLVETSPYEPYVPDQSPVSEPREVTHLVLSIDWAPLASVRKHIPVEGENQLWECWYSDKKQTTVQIRAPVGLILVPRDTEFTRF